jgi:hypothetical protein
VNTTIAAATLAPTNLPRASETPARNANAPSDREATVAASPEPQISPTAHALALVSQMRDLHSPGSMPPPAVAAASNTQPRAQLVENLTGDGSKFATLAADRFKPMTVAAFTDNDKKLLGEAYRLANGNEEDMKKLDELAGELGALRIRQRLNGELIASLPSPRDDLDGNGKINVDDTPYEVETAHLAILGEMKRLAEKHHMTIELFF